MNALSVSVGLIKKQGIVSLVSVFLYEELGWEPLLNVKNDPRPVLLSVLCFFHGKRRFDWALASFNRT